MTAGNSQKTPLQWRLNEFAEQKSADAVMLLTKAVPCTVSAIVSSEIVTVQYQLNSVYTLPQVTMPVATSQYVRLPIQIGDKGFAVPADYYLGGMSGLGGGIADLTQPGNLSAQVFLPIGNTTWSAVDNNALTLNGPNGCVIRDTGSKTVITLTPSGVVITLQSGDNVTIDGDLHVTGKVFAGYGGSDQVGLQTHTHGGVQSGGSNTSAPTAGT